jgi:predicted nucleic acid-binding protein
VQHDHIKSDVLKKYRNISGVGTPLALLVSLFQVNLILDANVVIRELLWATTKRRNPLARSELLEVLEVETVVAWAPTFLESEVEKYLAMVVSRGAKKEDVLDHWRKLRALITFVDVGGVPDEDAGHRDPKDVPYILLQKKIQAAIVTADADIAPMGGQVVPIQVMASLRTYSRAAAVQVSLQVGAYSIGNLSLHVVAQIAKSTSSAIGKVAAKLPNEVWLALLAAFCAAFVIPASRNWLHSRLGMLARQAGIGGRELAHLLDTFSQELRQHKAIADTALLQARTLIDPAMGTPEKKE